MNAVVADPKPDENVQHALKDELARIQRLLESVEDGVVTDQAHEPGDGPIDLLADAFGLSQFERDVLLLCSRGGARIGARLRPVQPPRSTCDPPPFATFGMALAVPSTCAHWSALAPAAALRHWQLVELADPAR